MSSKNARRNSGAKFSPSDFPDWYGEGVALLILAAVAGIILLLSPVV
jgi:hypothetical protein